MTNSTSSSRLGNVSIRKCAYITTSIIKNTVWTTLLVLLQKIHPSFSKLWEAICCVMWCTVALLMQRFTLRLMTNFRTKDNTDILRLLERRYGAIYYNRPNATGKWSEVIRVLLTLFLTLKWNSTSHFLTISAVSLRVITFYALSIILWCYDTYHIYLTLLGLTDFLAFSSAHQVIETASTYSFWGGMLTNRNATVHVDVSFHPVVPGGDDRFVYHDYHAKNFYGTYSPSAQTIAYKYMNTEFVGEFVEDSKNSTRKKGHRRHALGRHNHSKPLRTFIASPQYRNRTKAAAVVATALDWMSDMRTPRFQNLLKSLCIIECLVRLILLKSKPTFNCVASTQREDCYNSFEVSWAIFCLVEL